MASYGIELTITYTAWDTAANAAKTGDVANHTMRVIRDGVATAATNAPAESENGEYTLVLTAAEMQAKTITVAGSSSTANVTIVPVKLATSRLPNVAPGAENGLPVCNASGDVKATLDGEEVTLTDAYDAAKTAAQADVMGTPAGDSIADDIAAVSVSGATPAEVWAYGTRTLTTPASQLADAFSGDTITCHRGDELTVSFSGLGSIAGRLALWITAKKERTNTDAQSLIQCIENTGLVVLNGAVATTTDDGEIDVTDEDAGDLTWTVKAEATAVLSLLKTGCYDVQWRDEDGDVHTLSDGTFKVTLDVTRATELAGD